MPKYDVLNLTKLIKLSILFLFFVSNTSFAKWSCIDNFSSSLRSDQTNFRVKIDDGDLTLQPLGTRYFKQLAKLYSVPGVNKFYLGANKIPTLAADIHIKRALKSSGGYRQSFDTIWAIEYKGKFAGIFMMSEAKANFLGDEYTVQFRKYNQSDLYLGIAYALYPELQGKGLATRALQLTIKYAQEVMKAKYIFARVNVFNSSSLALLYRNGFKSVTPEFVERQRLFKKLN